MTLDFEVSRHRLQLGTRDSTTGWYSASYSESTIEMIIVPRGSTFLSMMPGAYVREDRLGRTCDPVSVGDEIEDSGGTYYEVKGIRPYYIGDSFVWRDCDLTMLKFKNLSGGSYTASSVEDARYRTKDYLETYLDDDALPEYIVAYGKPTYPMVKVFDTKGVDLVYSLGEPDSTPMMDPNTQAAYGYEEHVPIETYCIDKSNISGTELKWQAESELRRIVETYPTGSLRSLERRGDNDRDLGTFVLYSARFILNYRRDTT